MVDVPPDSRRSPVGCIRRRRNVMASQLLFKIVAGGSFARSRRRFGYAAMRPEDEQILLLLPSPSLAGHRMFAPVSEPPLRRYYPDAVGARVGGARSARVASLLRNRARCGSLRRFRWKTQRNPGVGTRCQRLISRTWRTCSCEHCASNHRTRPNHFPLPFLRHASDWRFTTFDLDQIFQAVSGASA